MRHFFSNALHLFVIFMMVIFVIGAILAITGNFDHWTERYRLKRRRRRLLRKKNREGGTNTNNTPYHSTNADEETTAYNDNSLKIN